MRKMVKCTPTYYPTKINFNYKPLVNINKY